MPPDKAKQGVWGAPQENSRPLPQIGESPQRTALNTLLALAATAPRDDLDTLADEALDDWEALLQPALAPLTRAVEQATSPADLQRRLAAAIPQSDTRALAHALGSAMFKARGLGEGGYDRIILLV